MVISIMLAIRRDSASRWLSCPACSVSSSDTKRMIQTMCFRFLRLILPGGSIIYTAAACANTTIPCNGWSSFSPIPAISPPMWCATPGQASPISTTSTSSLIGKALGHTKASTTLLYIKSLADPDLAEANLGMITELGL